MHPRIKPRKAELAGEEEHYESGDENEERKQVPFLNPDGSPDIRCFAISISLAGKEPGSPRRQSIQRIRRR